MDSEDVVREFLVQSETRQYENEKTHRNALLVIGGFFTLFIGLCTWMAKSEKKNPTQPTPIEQKADAQPPKTSGIINYRADWAKKAIVSRAAAQIQPTII